MTRRLLPRILLSLVLLPISGLSSQAPGFSPATAPSSALGPPPTALSAADRQQVIDSVIAHLQDSYILPAIGKQMTDAVRARSTQPEYTALTSGQALADRLTLDLFSISRDKHIRVVYSSPILPSEDSDPSAADNTRYRDELDQTNCGFRSLEILPGNIGYLRMDYFGSTDLCSATAALSLKFISHTGALIFDLRQNRGGDPRMVSLLLSSLFEQPTHLTDIYNRRDHKATEYWTTPEKLEARMPTQPVYVLTSRMSFSAAEEFAYDLKNLRRAVLIGERTGGASHPIRNHRINDHFFISVPEYQYVNAITHTDWEGIGVTPDIPAAPWNALLLAQQMAQRTTQTRLSHPAPAPFRISTPK